MNLHLFEHPFECFNGRKVSSKQLLQQPLIASKFRAEEAPQDEPLLGYNIRIQIYPDSSIFRYKLFGSEYFLFEYPNTILTYPSNAHILKSG